jgi:hypothetical protein
MSTCTTCYGTNTAQPCASVGCLSTNYAKCISYSGANLFCQQGSIATFTFTGVAVSSSVDVTVTASVTGGNGTDATFVVVRKAGETTYEVTLENQGAGYEVSDVLTIPGNLLGGATPANDVAITITGLTPVIANGSNLDSVIANLNNRLCLVSTQSPSGLDYTAFNYQCLRVGGNLESVGTPITTAQGFTEAVAAALCSLNTRVKSVEVPQIIVDSYFGGSIISGTSTLVQILNKYGEAIGDVNDSFTINSPHTCNTFTHLTNLTAKPSPTTSLGTWFDWVSTNLCNNYTILDGKITEQNTEHALINTFLYGINQPYPLSRGNNFVNTACLSGGSATSDVRTAVNLIATNLCSLTTQVNSLSNPTYTLGWSSCFSGTYPTNSLWGVQNISTYGFPLSGFLNTTTLQTHLDQIVKVLSNLNLKAGPGITLTNDGCGAIISASSSFNCSQLNSCTLNNLGDVNIGVPSDGSILLRNTISNQWEDASMRLIVQYSNSTFGSGGIDNYSYERASGQLRNINTVKFPINSEAQLQPDPGCPLFVQPLSEYSSSPLNLPQIRKIQTSGLATPSKYTGFILTNNTVSPYTFANNTSIPVLNWINDSLHPNNDIDILTTATIKSSTGVFVGLAQVVVHIVAIASAGPSFQLIRLKNRRGSSGGDITLAPNESLEIFIGGFSWSINRDF